MENCTAPGLDIQELLCATAFAHAVTHLELRETHVSWVILTGSVAYKIKKPQKLDFIDASTLDRRRRLCEEEFRLNQRFTPELYLDVVAIARDASGIHVGGPGSIIEYAVRMKQFDTSQELPALLTRGEVAVAEVTSLAERLAEFHCRAAVAPRSGSFDYTAQLRNSVLGNMATLLSHLGSTQQFPELGMLIDWTHDSLHAFAARFRRRQEGGFVRECHGDLHAHNIVRWEGRLTPFDCLEFDPDLRWIDVMNDIAFLIMDFAALGRMDLAHAFLSRYVEHTGDYDGVRLLAFYAVYRAAVRAMIDALIAEQHPARRVEFYRRLHLRIRTAAQFMQARSATLFIMHGPSGSGKSWLSERLVPPAQALRIRSDLERRRLAGAAPAGDPAFPQGAYAPEATRRVYARVAQCAENCLLAGVNTIVDAAFLEAEHRRMFKDLAGRVGAHFVIVSCVAGKDEMARRIAARCRARTDPSQADLGVLERQLRHLDPLDADEQAQAMTVDTTLPDPANAAMTTLRARGFE